MQIIATMRYHYMPVRMAKVIVTTPNASKAAETLNHSYIAGRNIK